MGPSNTVPLINGFYQDCKIQYPPVGITLKIIALICWQTYCTTLFGMNTVIGI